MSRRPVFRTPLCDLLGIEYPILQSGMGGVAGPDLAAEVSNAGGLGILAGLLVPAETLRKAIHDVRARTSRPFGVNLLLSADLRPPVAAGQVADEAVQAVHAALNPIRKDLGLPEVVSPPSPPPDLVSDALEVILEERVPVFSVGLGNPGGELVAECHRRGMRVIAMVASVEDAKAVEATGLDAVVAQGWEAGGHRSHFDKPASPGVGAVGALSLIPQIADAVHIPVIAAGGIVDARGLVAALVLGASGVLMGTRFVATRESMAPEMYKKALLERWGDATTVTTAFTGRYARALRNEYVERYEGSGAPVLPFIWQRLAADDIFKEATAQGNPSFVPLWAGQSVGLIQNLPGVAEILEDLVQEARRLLQRRLSDIAALD
jgi:nitronate monooxygenase